MVSAQHNEPFDQDILSGCGTFADPPGALTLSLNLPSAWLEAHRQPSYAVLRHVQPPTASSGILAKLNSFTATSAPIARRVPVQLAMRAYVQRWVTSRPLLERNEMNSTNTGREVFDVCHLKRLEARPEARSS